MAGIVLNVERRERVGSSGSRAARRDNKVPGVLYGGPRGPVPIAVGRNELVKAIRSGKFLAHMVTLDHKGERQPVIPKDIQFHPVTEEPVHIDLYRVEEDSVIEVDVPVHFINHDASPGLKRGGALIISEHTLKLKVPAGRIPEEVVVDLAGLDVGAVVHVSALTLPPGAEAHMKGGDVALASIGGKMAASADEPAEGETAAS